MSFVGRIPQMFHFFLLALTFLTQRLPFWRCVLGSIDYVQGTPDLHPQWTPWAAATGLAGGCNPAMQCRGIHSRSPCCTARNGGTALQGMISRHWQLHRPAHNHSLGPSQQENPALVQHPYRLRQEQQCPTTTPGERSTGPPPLYPPTPPSGRLSFWCFPDHLWPLLPSVVPLNTSRNLWFLKVGACVPRT